MTTATATAPIHINGRNVPAGLISFWGSALCAMGRIDHALPPAERWESRPAASPDGAQPQWLQPTIRRMVDLPWDDCDWNDDAKPTDPAAVANLLVLLAAVLDDAAPPPLIVPTWRGGVQAEWHANGIDLEIEIDPTEPGEYFFTSSTEEYEEQIAGNFERLVALAGRLSPRQRRCAGGD